MVCGTDSSHHRAVYVAALLGIQDEGLKILFAQGLENKARLANARLADQPDMDHALAIVPYAARRPSMTFCWSGAATKACRMSSRVVH